SGWFTLRFSAGDTVSEYAYYVFAEADWQARAAMALTKANQDNYKKGDNEVEELQVKRPINTIYFFVLFVLAMGYLWLEPKLRS
ncbi:MAG: hypothetical protein VX253_01555, partial [Bacteroidota bacterium]|nr:hypothetical protein [Bacteroidota bacterium]